MLIFKQRKPRGYHHQFIYSDERKERLRKMEEQAYADLGLSRKEEVKSENHQAVSTRINFRRERNLKPGLLGNIPTLIMVIMIVALLLWLFDLIQ